MAALAATDGAPAAELGSQATGAQSRRAVPRADAGRRLASALSELASAAVDPRTRARGTAGTPAGRTQLATRSTAGVAQLERLIRAYERVRAEDLLFRERMGAARRRLQDSAASATALGRLADAERAYDEHMGGPTAYVDRALASWRRSLPRGSEEAQDGAALTMRERLADELLSALLETAALLAPVEERPRILRAAALPHRSSELAPRPLVTEPAVTPSYHDATDPAPTAADLAGTPESPLSNFIVQQAAALDHDPVAIFEFVRNEVASEWYAGAMKGAEETLRQRSGNDVDQAALLIALLRASSQPARFVHGVIELPLAMAAQSLNVAEGPQVLVALARSGVAHQAVVSGGRLSAVKVEHTWVSARLPYGNYRGTVVDLSARTWVPLAPALKRFEETVPAGVLREMGFDSVAFASGYLSTPQTSDPLTQVRQQVESWLAVHRPNSGYPEQLGKRGITAQHVGLAPSSMPVAVAAVLAERPALEASRSHRVALTIRDEEPAENLPALELSLPLWDLANHRVTLSYLPATVEDHQTIALFGGLDAVPPYLVRLRPHVRIDDRTAAVGEGTMDMASRQHLELRFTGPAGTVEVAQSVLAGGLQAIAVGAQRFRALADGDRDEGEESRGARLLSQLALSYGTAWDASDAELGGLLAVSTARPMPALVFAGSEVAVSMVGELPVDLEWQGVTLDAALRIADPVAREASQQTASGRDFLRLSSLQGSALEQLALEELFVVESISADEGLARARESGIAIHEVNDASVDAVLPLLDHPPTVLAEMEQQARAGLVLEIPRARVRHRDWLGSAWRAEDPATGAAGYFLAGGLAGGATVVEPADWPVQSFVWDLMAPYAAEPNPDPLAAAHVVKVGGTDGQVGEVGKLLPLELAVLVFDDVGRPVQGAQVDFASVAGDGRLGADRTSVTLTTDRLGMASIPLRLGTDTALEPVFLRLEPDDPRLTRALRHVVEATVTSRDGSLQPAQPFTAIGLPGSPVALERKNERSQPIQGTTSLWSDTMLVGAVDAFGNDVSNVPLRFAVAPLEELARCPSNVIAPHPLLNAVVFAAEGGCASRQPRLGECGAPSLVVPSGPDGAAVGVILGSSSRHAYRVRVDAPETGSLAALSLGYRYEESADDCTPAGVVVRATPLYIDETGANVNAAAAGGGFAFEVHLFAYEGYPEPASPVACPDDPASSCVVGGGRLLRARADRLYLRRGDGTTGQWLTDEIPLQVGTDHVYRAAMDVPAGRNGYWVVGGHVTHLVDQGTGEVRRVREDRCVTDAFYCVSGRAPEVTGLTPRITSVSPQPVELEETTGGFVSAIEVGYLTLPGTYRALGTAVELLEDGSPTLQRPGSSRTGDGRTVLPRGSRGTHAQLVVNPSSPVEVRSPVTPLSLTSRLFPSFSRHIALLQDVDLANGRVCRQPDVFRFSLSRPARVEVTLRQIIDHEPGAEPQLGASQTLLLSDLPAGEHDVPLLPEELLPGLYKVILEGTDALGNEEVEEGTAEIGFRTSDDLPLGHVLVQGIDLFDGSLVLSRADFSVPGRGEPLALSRVYASGAGGALGPLGAGWTFSYDSRMVATPCGELILRGGDGSGIRFVSDGAGGFRALRGYHGTLVVDAGRLGFDYYTKGGNRYRFEPSRPNEWVLDSISDPNGNTTDLTYVAGPAGGLQLASVTDSTGRALRFRWERREFVTTTGDVIVRVEGPGGLTMSYEYDAWGNLARAAREPHPDGRPSRVERYEYSTGPGHPFEQRHLLVGAVDEVRGAAVRYTYSTGSIAVPGGGLTVHRDSVVAISLPEGGIWRFAADSSGLASGASELVATVTDPRAQVTTYRLNRYGAPLVITDPLGGSTRTTWDLEHVAMTSRTDARENTTTFVYDEHGNLLTEAVTVRDVDGVEQTLILRNTYWPQETFTPPFLKDRLATRTDRAGHTTLFLYDTRGNLVTARIEVENPEGIVSELGTTHSYYTNGDLRSTTDPRGNTTVFAYDAAGNLSSITDPLGGVTATTWDARSRPIRHTDAEGRATSLAYDTLAREIERVLPSVSGGEDAVQRVAYDDGAGMQTAVDAEGRSTVSSFDREGRLVRAVDAAGAVKVLDHDAAGNKTLESSWHDASTPRTDTSFQYDPAGRLVVRDEPLGRRTRYDYDPAGNLVRESLSDTGDPGFPPRVTEHDYDEINRRVRSRRVGDGFIATEERKLDGEGREVLFRDALGRETAQRHDALGRVIERQEPEWRPGRRKRTLFFYDGNGNLIRERRINEPKDQQREWEYDEVDRMVLSRDAAGATRLHQYDRVGNLVREVDPLLDVVEHSYDARDRRTSTTLHLNRVSELGVVSTSYEYDRVGNLVAENLPNGNVRRHRYDRLDRLVESGDGLGSLAAYAYDARGNRSREVDANRNETRNTYDLLGRLVRQELPADRLVLRTFDVAGNVTAETNPRGHAIRRVYDRLDRVTEVHDPAPHAGVRRFAYDLIGNKIAETDRRGFTTDFTYDSLDRLATITSPALAADGGARLTTTYAYDAVGNQLSATDRRGIRTEHTYDAENRLIETLRVGVRVESREYDAAGNLRFSTDGNGNVTGYEYDERGLVTAENRPLAAITSVRRDPMGDVVAEVDPEGRETQRSYDLRRRLVEERNGGGERTLFEYDGVGNRTARVRPNAEGDAGLFRWEYDYDAANRLVAVRDPAGAETRHGYDGNGNRITQRDALGRTTSFTFDELDRRATMTYPDGAVERYGFDAEGNLLSRIDPNGQAFAITYDELGRRLVETFPTSGGAGVDELSRIAYGHDPNGNLTVVDETYTGPAGLRRWRATYDPFDRPEIVTDAFGKTIRHGYDAAGNRTTLTAPDGLVTRYSYDALNRVFQVDLPSGGGVAEHRYLRDSRLDALLYPNGARADHSYDLAGRVQAIVNRHGSQIVSSYVYRYDLNGNRLEQVETNGGPPETTLYDYDTADRLVEVAYPEAVITYTYDAAGNRLTERRVASGGGALLEDRTYGYDIRDRLLSVVDRASPAESATHGDDGDGN